MSTFRLLNRSALMIALSIRHHHFGLRSIGQIIRCESTIANNSSSSAPVLSRLDDIQKMKLQNAGIMLYYQCADGYDFVKLCTDFNLNDSMPSWHRLTVLHIWLILARMRNTIDQTSFLYFRDSMLETFAADIDNRIKLLQELKMRKGLKRDEYEQLQALLTISFFEYDEGLLFDDMVLAGAIWRCFYLHEPIDPIYLNRVVRYVRANMARLLKVDIDELMAERAKLNWTVVR